jgi:hypothetical protein
VLRVIAAVLACVACRVPDKYLVDGTGSDVVPDAPPGASGEAVWVRSLSAMSPLSVEGGTGGIVVTGYIYATVDLGGGLLTAVGMSDLVIASFTEADATHLYSVRHGAAGGEFAWDDVTDPTGAPYVLGVSYGTVDLGQGMVMGGGGVGADGYIGRYASGEPGWVARLVGPGEDKILASALAPNAEIYGAGWFESTTSFNGGMLTSAGGRDIFLARFNTFTGAVDLTKQYGGVGRDEVSGAASSGSNFVLVGFFDDTIDFGGTAMPITASGGGLDGWVAKLDPNGDGVWAVRFGGPGDDRELHAAVDSNGDVYVAGSYTTQIVFGTYTLNVAGGTGTDHFLVKLDGTTGAVAWATSIGSTGSEGGGRVAVDNAGHVVFGGQLAGALDSEPTLGGKDGLVAVYNTADGSLKWRRVISTAMDDNVTNVAFGRSGDVLAAVGLGAAYDFGVPLIGAPDPIAVVVRLRL